MLRVSRKRRHTDVFNENDALGSEFAGALRRAEQVIGREGETATLLSRCPLNFTLRVGGFAPRQLHRSAACV